MNTKIKHSSLFKAVFLFMIGFMTYVTIEVLFRGYSHWAMGVVGGICFLIIGALNNIIPWRMGLIWQMLVGGAVITLTEFIAGLILNVWLGLGIWDYSLNWGNVFGQICPLFSILWVGLALVAIWLDDYIRWLVFAEEKPHYTFY